MAQLSELFIVNSSSCWHKVVVAVLSNDLDQEFHRGTNHINKHV